MYMHAMLIGVEREGRGVGRGSWYTHPASGDNFEEDAIGLVESSCLDPFLQVVAGKSEVEPFGYTHVWVIQPVYVCVCVCVCVCEGGL